MKINIRGFTLKQLRRNAIFFAAVSATIFTFIMIWLFFLFHLKITLDKISISEKEIENLKKKKDIIDYKVSLVQNEIDIRSMNTIFSALVPAEEDFFSISLVLENLSVQSGFAIHSYSIAPEKSKKGKLTFTIQGQGNLETFISFLKEYQFSGGRLLTVSDVKYSSVPLPSGEITLSVYSGKPANRPITKEYSEEEKNLQRKIMEKVSIQIKPKQIGNADYPVKSDPF